MRTKSLVLLVLALGCGLVASIGISQIIEQNKNSPVATETEAILVAMKPITAQEQLKAENVKLEQWPKNLIPPKALTKIEEIEGRRVRHSLAPGEPILQNKLVSEQDMRPTIEVPPGYRLKAVHADAVSAVGNLIQPGDRVDVLVYLKNFKGGAQMQATSTILQDIKVFAVNDQWRPNDESGGESIATKNVTLLLTPEQAERLTLASELGKVSLVLRSPDDQLKTEVSHGTTASDLFGISQERNREGEQNFLASKGESSGLLGMLGVGNNNQPVDVAAAPAAIQVFTMQLLEGPQARTVEFSRADSKAKWQSSDLGSSPGAAPAPTTNPLPPANQDTATGAAPDLGGAPAGEPVILGPPAEKD
jgi:pilus assembly protein CpaB